MAVFNQPELVEKRIISGRGYLRIPVDQSTRLIYLQCTLLRDPTPNYINNKFADAKGNYANVQWYKNGYVCRTDTVEYELQRFDWIEDITAQALYGAMCQHAEVINSIVNLATALGGALIAVPGRGFFPIVDFPQEVRFLCRDSCGLQVELWRQVVDICPDIPPPPPPPPPPEVPPSKVPPNQAFDGENGNPRISPPYFPPDDVGDTVPAPIDQDVPPENQGEQCTVYLLTYDATRKVANEPPIRYTVQVFGEYGTFRLTGENESRIEFYCRGTGTPTTPPPSCEALDWYFIRVSGVGYASVSIVSIEPV